MADATEDTGRLPVDPYRAYELPAAAARAMSHAYVATAVGMPWLFALEWLARFGEFAEDELERAALRCLVPGGVSLVLALVARRLPIARFCPFLQGYALMCAIALVLGLSASVTGGIRSPYLISLQTMFYLWGLIMPGGLRLAVAPVLASAAIFFGVLSYRDLELFADARSTVTVAFTAASVALSLAYAEALERRRRAIWMASSTDSLSGLFNRRYLIERFDSLRARASRTGRPLSVLLFDVDRFKRINDEHGHAMGDEVIRRVARVLLESTRAIDLSGRIGGEEFALVLFDADERVAGRVGERVRAAVEAMRVPLEEGELRTTLSVGVATQPAGAERTVDELLREADRALYESKRTGRNRVTVLG